MSLAQQRSIVVHAVWDKEAEVFVATSDDIIGLIAEAPTSQELEKKLQILIPELIELNGWPDGEEDRPRGEVPLFLMAEQVSKINLGGRWPITGAMSEQF